MSAASLRSRYLGDAVATSSPQQVLVMLYDRLALDLERAQVAVAAGEREAASEQLRDARFTGAGGTIDGDDELHARIIHTAL